MRNYVRLSLLALVLFASLAQSQVYNYFPPPGISYGSGTGMQLGSPTGGAKGAGTLNAVGLYVNGAAVSTGTVTSVALTTPSYFTVSGSPITSAGTLAISAAGAQTANNFLATPCGTTGALALRVICTSDFPASGVTAGTYTAATVTVDATGRITSASNGSGSVTSVGLSEASTTPIFTITNSPVTSSGTLTETLKTQTANTIFAGPSVGSANQPTFRAMVPNDLPLTSNIVWTGQHTFTPASGVGITINGGASSDTADFENGASQFTRVVGHNGTGTSDGLVIAAGTNTSDTALLITSRAATNYFQVDGDGGSVVGSPTGGDKGGGSLNALALFRNGLQVPLISLGLISVSGSACTIATGTAQAVNLASCTYNGTGDYNVNFTTNYNSTPVCTFSGTGASAPKVLTTETFSNSTVEVGSFLATSGAKTDGNFTIVCVGN